MDANKFPEEGRVFTGVVKKFFDDKGFGFINDSENREFFVHFQDILTPHEGGYRSLVKGQHVKARGFEGPRGFYAKEVSMFSPSEPRSGSR